MSTDRELGRVFVTGGASGLGAAVVTAVEKAGGQPAVLDIASPAGRVPHVEVDLADTEAATAAVGQLVAELGPPQSVVTAAGTDSCGPLDRVSALEWERVVRVNLFGTAAVVRAALPHLRKSHGTVVTVASTLGMRPAADATAYCASKHGVVGFSRALAMELAGQVGVTMVVPGGMRTAFFDGRDPQYQPAPDAALNDPAEVADLVVMALRQPVGCEVRELLVAPSTDPSWP